MKRTRPWKRLQIVNAGVWHNLLTALSSYLVLQALLHTDNIFYTSYCRGERGAGEGGGEESNNHYDVGNFISSSSLLVLDVDPASSLLHHLTPAVTRIYAVNDIPLNGDAIHIYESILSNTKKDKKEDEGKKKGHDQSFGTCVLPHLVTGKKYTLFSSSRHQILNSVTNLLLSIYNRRVYFLL